MHREQDRGQRQCHECHCQISSPRVWTWQRRSSKRLLHKRSILSLPVTTGNLPDSFKEGRYLPMKTVSPKTRAILGSVLFLVVAPGTVVGLIPWWISKWQVQPLPPGFWIIQPLGLLILAGSILVLLEAFARFAFQGIGTPAPVAPTRHLVVSGLYRRVRNPMYVAVVAAILGQSMMFGNLMLVWYAALSWFVTHLFVVFYEEPTLRKNFGDEYAEFCANVPRSIPRFRAWSGPLDCDRQ
jgi:protein-S-isoprenylcysteine O-methyltransferase Ste14